MGDTSEAGDRLRQRLAETIGPGIDVGVEVHQSDRPESLAQSAQQGQGDRMIAADGDQMANRSGLLLDQSQRGFDVTKSEWNSGDADSRLGRGAAGPEKGRRGHEGWLHRRGAPTAYGR